MTVTRKEFLTENYLKMIQDLKATKKFKNDIFPIIDDDMDIADICYLFNLIFPTPDNYKEGITQLLETKGIVLQEKDKPQIYGIILPFIELFKRYM